MTDESASVRAGAWIQPRRTPNEWDGMQRLLESYRQAVLTWELSKGCIHYSRRCQIFAECCQQFFPCRLCHDEEVSGGPDPHPSFLPSATLAPDLSANVHVNVNEVEGRGALGVDGGRRRRSIGAGLGSRKRNLSCAALNMKDVRLIVCSDCELVQKPGAVCEGCQVSFGLYFCDKCLFWANDPLAPQVPGKTPPSFFHCDGCGLCRRGERERYFHCDACDSCFPVELAEGHRCGGDGRNQVCPICLEDSFASAYPVAILPCQHPVHYHCLALCSQRNSREPRCALCMAALARRSLSDGVSQGREM